MARAGAGPVQWAENALHHVGYAPVIRAACDCDLTNFPRPGLAGGWRVLVLVLLALVRSVCLMY